MGAWEQNRRRKKDPEHDRNITSRHRTSVKPVMGLYHGTTLTRCSHIKKLVGATVGIGKPRAVTAQTFLFPLSHCLVSLSQAIIYLSHSPWAIPNLI